MVAQLPASERVGLGVLVVLVALLWLGGLGAWRMLDRAVVEQDETYYLNFAWTWQSTGRCAYALQEYVLRPGHPEDNPFWFDRIKWLYCRPLGFLLSGTGPSLVVGRAMSLAAFSIAVWFMFLGARSSLGGAAAIGTVLVVAADARSTLVANLVRPEAVLTAWAAVLAWWLARQREDTTTLLSAGLVGIWAGLGAAIHPNGIGMGLAALAWTVGAGRRSRLAPMIVGILLGWGITMAMGLDLARLPDLVRFWAHRFEQPAAYGVAGGPATATIWKQLVGQITGTLEVTGVTVVPIPGSTPLWVFGLGVALLSLGRAHALRQWLAGGGIYVAWIAFAGYHSNPLYVVTTFPFLIPPIGWVLGAAFGNTGGGGRTGQFVLAAAGFGLAIWLSNSPWLWAALFAAAMLIVWGRRQGRAGTELLARVGLAACLFGLVAKDAVRTANWVGRGWFVPRYSHAAAVLNEMIPASASVLGPYPYWMALYPRKYWLADAVPQFEQYFVDSPKAVKPDVVLHDYTVGWRFETDWAQWVRKRLNLEVSMVWALPAQTRLTGQKNLDLKDGPFTVFQLTWPSRAEDLEKARRARRLAIDGVRAVLNGQLTEAARRLEQARRLDHLDGTVDLVLAEVYVDLAHVAFDRKEISACGSYLRKALSVNPKHGVARSNLSLLER